MAEGLFNYKNPKPKSFRAVSGGLYTCDGFPASENAIWAMREMGIDITDHLSRVLTEKIVKDADYVFCMTAVHYDRLLEEYPAYKNRIFTISDHDISDPFGQDLETYRRCARELSEAIDQLLKRLAGENDADSKHV